MYICKQVALGIAAVGKGRFLPMQHVRSFPQADGHYDKNQMLAETRKISGDNGEVSWPLLISFMWREPQMDAAQEIAPTT